MKKLNEKLVVGDRIKIDSIVYKCAPQLGYDSCKFCDFRKLVKTNGPKKTRCLDIYCDKTILILEEPKIFNLSIQRVGYKLIFKVSYK